MSEHASATHTATIAAAPPLMTIGRLSELTGVPATTLRYYERRGLVPPAARVGGQRRYDSTSLARLMVIKFCTFAGLSLDDISNVLDDHTPDREATRSVVEAHAARIDEQIKRLRLAKDMMLAATRCHCPTVERCECGALAPVVARMRRFLARQS